MQEAFKCCGQIDHIRTLQGLKGCNGIAFIRFAKPESCDLALKLNGTEILDREIRVERYNTKKLAQKQMKKEKSAKQRKLGKKPKAGEDGKMTSPKATGGGADMKMGKKKNKVKPVKEFMGTKSIDNKKVISMQLNRYV